MKKIFLVFLLLLGNLYAKDYLKEKWFLEVVECEKQAISYENIQKANIELCLKSINTLNNMKNRTKVQTKYLAQNYFNTGIIYANNKKLKNNKKAVDLWVKGGELGEVNSQYNLATAFDSGSYSQKIDYKKAIYWYTLASKQGDYEAQFNLGLLYFYGKGTPKNEKRGFELFKQASKKGHIESSYILGFMYDRGRNVIKDYKQAAKYYLFAAKKGHTEAQSELGFLYEKGNGVKQSYKEALKWYSESAKKDTPSALLSLGLMYAQGKGVKMNKLKAYDYFYRGAKQGDVKAQKNLDYLCKESPWACK